MKKLIMSLVAATILFCGFTAMAEDEVADLTFLQHYAIGVAYDLNDFDDHSIAFISLVTWRDVLNFDVGLVDFEQVQTEGDLWWQDLNPVAGLSADVQNLGKLVPQIQPILDWIPNWVGIGAGFYSELDELTGLDDVDALLYVTINWQW